MNDMKIAIAFGGGKESFKLLQMLKDEKPLLITCLDKDERKLKPKLQKIAKLWGLEIRFLSIGFKESWEWSEMPPKLDLVATNYTNSIFLWYKDQRIPFHILYVGRTKKDLEKRTDIEGLPDEEPVIFGVRFPLWED